MVQHVNNAGTQAAWHHGRYGDC